MPAHFQIIGLHPQNFAVLFDLDDVQLKQHGAVRVLATSHPGFPCRVSLQDAHVGEELILLPFEHQAADSPYRASGPIFVRRDAVQNKLAVDEITPYVSSRLMSVRGYDHAHQMIAQFADENVAYIHLHNAKRGCFSCLVLRA
jgi:Protein of unknown function (DUF1203)